MVSQNCLLSQLKYRSLCIFKKDSVNPVPDSLMLTVYPFTFVISCTVYEIYCPFLNAYWS